MTDSATTTIGEVSRSPACTTGPDTTTQTQEDSSAKTPLGSVAADRIFMRTQRTIQFRLATLLA